MKTPKLSCVWKAVVIAFLLGWLILSAIADLSNNKALLFIGTVVYGKPQFLDVSISPCDVSLAVNQTQLFTGEVSSANMSLAPFTCTWTASSVNGSTITVNGTSYYLSDSQVVLTDLTLNSESFLSFGFPTETQDLVSLHLTVEGTGGQAGYADISISFSSPSLCFYVSPSTAKYIVQSDGLGWYRTINSTGQCVQSGTVAEDLVNNAFGNLTVGRTRQESVCLEGNFTITSSITPSSYSILNVLGTVTLANAANTYAISIDNRTQVDIIGGFVDGNSANQQNFATNYGLSISGSSSFCNIQSLTISDCKTNCMCVVNATDISIDNCVFTNGTDNCLIIDGSSYGAVYRVHVSSCTASYGSDYGFTVFGSHVGDITFTDCVAYSTISNRSLFGGDKATGFAAELGASGVTFSNCISYDQGIGFAVLDGSSNISILNPTVYNCSATYFAYPRGIDVSSTSKNVIIQGGAIYNCVQFGINAGATTMLINNVQISNITRYGGMARGISVAGDNVSITSCQITECPESGVLIYACNYTNIQNCTVTNCGIGVSEGGGADYTMMMDCTLAGNVVNSTVSAPNSIVSNCIGVADYP